MKRACIAGWPSSHSRSLLIPGYWLCRCGIEGSHRRKAVRPEEAADFPGNQGMREYAGCNATVLHKHTACDAMPAARGLDAASAPRYAGDRSEVTADRRSLIARDIEGR